MTTIVDFRSKAPFRYCTLAITFDLNAEPAALIDDLKQIGWTESSWVARMSSLDGRQEIHVAKPGMTSASWTTLEKKSFMSTARAVLNKHGFFAVPVNRMSFAQAM